MRFQLLLATLLLTMSLVVAPAQEAKAGHWFFGSNVRSLNHLLRVSGYGWSDGYHANGSPTSWTPRRHGYYRSYSNPVMGWPAAGAPVMESGLQAAPQLAPPPPSAVVPRPATYGAE